MGFDPLYIKIIYTKGYSMPLELAVDDDGWFGFQGARGLKCRSQPVSIHRHSAVSFAVMVTRAFEALWDV